MSYNPYICIFCRDVLNNGWNHCATFDFSTACILTGFLKNKFSNNICHTGKTLSVCIDCLKKIPAIFDSDSENELEPTSNYDSEDIPNYESKDSPISNLLFDNDEEEHKYYSKIDYYEIPEEIKEKYPDLITKQIRRVPTTFECINSKIQNLHFDLCMLAIELYPDNLRYLWNRDVRIIKRALELDGLTLRFVYKSELSLELCMIALRQNSQALKFVRNDALKSQCLNLLGKNIC
jgi:hypothetical protein